MTTQTAWGWPMSTPVCVWINKGIYIGAPVWAKDHVIRAAVDKALCDFSLSRTSLVNTWWWAFCHLKLSSYFHSWTSCGCFPSLSHSCSNTVLRIIYIPKLCSLSSKLYQNMFPSFLTSLFLSPCKWCTFATVSTTLPQGNLYFLQVQSRDVIRDVFFSTKRYVTLLDIGLSTGYSWNYILAPQQDVLDV